MQIMDGYQLRHRLPGDSLIITTSLNAKYIIRKGMVMWMFCVPDEHSICYMTWPVIILSVFKTEDGGAAEVAYCGHLGYRRDITPINRLYDYKKGFMRNCQLHSSYPLYCEAVADSIKSYSNYVGRPYSRLQRSLSMPAGCTVAKLLEGN